MVHLVLALLRSLGNLLVDLHGPHDHQSLFSRDQQTYLLDRFCGAEELRQQFAGARRTLLDLQKEKISLLLDEQSAAREVDLLTHQVDEIEAARLQLGEEEILLSRQRMASNMRRIADVCAQLMQVSPGMKIRSWPGSKTFARLTRELIHLDPRSEELSRL